MSTISAPCVRVAASVETPTAVLLDFASDAPAVGAYGIWGDLLAQYGDADTAARLYAGRLREAVGLALMADCRDEITAAAYRALVAAASWPEIADVIRGGMPESDDAERDRDAYDSPEFTSGRSEVEDWFGTSPGDELLVLPDPLGDRDPDRHSVGRAHAAQLR